MDRERKYSRGAGSYASSAVTRDEWVEVNRCAERERSQSEGFCRNER